jgi:putative transposase
MIHAFCAMSSHIHYVVTDLEGNLPEFLALFHRLVANGVQAIREWDGAVWNRSQTSVVELCTRQAIVEKIAYTLTNPVQAGLVRRARDWPGFRTTVNDIGRKRLRARRPRKGLKTQNSKWAEVAQLDVSLPPSIDKADAESFRNDIRKEIRKIETTMRASIPQSKVLGARAAMQINPFDRSTSPESIRQIDPTFAVGRGNPEALKQAIRARREFRQSYHRAFMAWRSGNREVEFPSGTYAMRKIHGVKVATANRTSNQGYDNDQFSLIGS